MTDTYERAEFLAERLRRLEEGLSTLGIDPYDITGFLLPGKDGGPTTYTSPSAKAGNTLREVIAARKAQALAKAEEELAPNNAHEEHPEADTPPGTTLGTILTALQGVEQAKTSADLDRVMKAFFASMPKPRTLTNDDTRGFASENDKAVASKLADVIQGVKARLEATKPKTKRQRVQDAEVKRAIGKLRNRLKKRGLGVRSVTIAVNLG